MNGKHPAFNLTYGQFMRLRPLDRAFFSRNGGQTLSEAEVVYTYKKQGRPCAVSVKFLRPYIDMQGQIPEGTEMDVGNSNLYWTETPKRFMKTSH